ncbi:MAG: DNA-processing protein DprA [Patescibacteria group bacterium]|nr:DNA-processing protein DprA [Patescibacteria group bacterium]
MEERDYWLGFSVFPGVGPGRFNLLLKHFGSAKKAWNSSKQDFKELLGESLALKFDKFRSSFSINNYQKALKEKSVWFLTLKDKYYPQLLTQISNPPFVLYGRGRMPNFGAEVAFENFRVRSTDNSSSKSNINGANAHSENFESFPRLTNFSRTIAVVGTRRTTQYGREVTRLFTSELVDAGFTIVSGLAIGVDAISHKTAIENNGKTAAVLGCGIDCCNPETNKSLYDNIIQSGGCILSEVPLGHAPTKGLFPARNRIIAGLSLGVLVTEGAEDSGSLITAECAFKNSRKVFAVPGPITSNLSKGPYRLIGKGAKLVTDAKDIINDLGFKNYDLRIKNIHRKTKGETKEERKILSLLENESLHFDEIVRRLKFEPSLIGSTLSVLEVKGAVKSLEGGFFKII